MEIKFSQGRKLSEFNNPVPDIGQFDANDKKLLNKLVKNGTLIKFRYYWCYPLAKQKTHYILIKSIQT
jgi:hypothetical protein